MATYFSPSRTARDERARRLAVADRLRSWTRAGVAAELARPDAEHPPIFLRTVVDLARQKRGEGRG
jgi:hypothetical protein